MTSANWDVLLSVKYTPDFKERKEVKVFQDFFILTTC